MIYTTLPQVARHIRRTHSSFAGMGMENVLEVLGRMNANIMASPAMVGATFRAVTGAEYGGLNTLVTVNKLPDGGWECIETVAR